VTLTKANRNGALGILAFGKLERVESLISTEEESVTPSAGWGPRRPDSPGVAVLNRGLFG